MPTRPEMVLQIETADERAWADMYAAIPQDFAQRLALGHTAAGGYPVFCCARVPFIHFNAVGSTFGLRGPVSDADLDALRAAYATRGIGRHWLHTVPAVLPADLRGRLADRGYTESSRWDRVVRRPAPPPAARPDGPRRIEVRAVEWGTAEAWAEFVDGVYGLPTSPWLVALVDRPGWRHYVALEAGRIVAARSCFLSDGWGWLGIDAPVPGAMTKDYLPDQAILDVVVREVSNHHIIADIEAPDPERRGPAYGIFAGLDFEVAYTRVNLVR